MEANNNTVKLYYNTEREKLRMPEYGRNILEMVEQLRDIEDRDKRTEQAKAVVKLQAKDVTLAEFDELLKPAAKADTAAKE